MEIPEIRYAVRLNGNLLREKKVPSENIIELFKVHAEKLILFEQMREMLLSGDFAPKEQKEKMEELKELEFRAQELWGFPKDEKWHYWEFEIPGCCCPRMDNMERVGLTATRIYSGDCQWHKVFLKEK